MKRLGLISVALAWIIAVVILILALTDVYLDSIFKSYQKLVGITFIGVSWLLKISYNALITKR